MKRLVFFMSLICLVGLASCGSSAHAAPNPPALPPAHQDAQPDSYPVSQDPTWLAAKNGYKVHSGVSRNQPKGVVSYPFTGASFLNSSFPASFELNMNNVVPSIFEPSDGNHPNFGAGTGNWDDNHRHYYDHDFFDLCAPGATDIALYYWPFPPSFKDNVWVTDPLPATTTFWGAERTRGYLVYLAWQTPIPGYARAGMVDTTHYPSEGSTLYNIRDALNWEASGTNAGNWINYFYTITWWNTTDAAHFHLDVVTDLVNNSIPVVAEVNAALMPNWNEPGYHINHAITVVGYDDATHQYAYTDTCGKSTYCGDPTYGGDGGVHWVDQGTMWNAITNIPVNQDPVPAHGDGGWVW